MSINNNSDDTFEVDDPDQYVQQRRIKAILERRDAVLETRKNTLEMLSLNRIDPPTACRILKETVDGYIRESEHKIRDHLPGQSFGLEIDPSKVNEDNIETTSQRAAYVAWFAAPLGVVEAEGDGQAVKIQGLQQFLNLRHPIVFDYEVETRHPVRGLQTEQQTERQPVPMEASMQAYSILNSFWNTMDMDVTIQKAGLDVDEGFDSLTTDGATISNHTPEI